MAESITIENDGPLILATNYWQTTIAHAGKFFLSTNAGTFRLLIPQAHLSVVREMRSGREVVFSRGAMTLNGQHLPDMMELLFDDGSASPFSLHLSPGQLDRFPLDTDTTQAWTCTAWTQLVGTRGRRVLTRPAYYRHVRTLPDLRPWQP